ncbi:hypothetical protein E4U24_001748 [Claviceps purpurea]|nr:hypothetical protein E4U24_001748 [Claviceps purpurea]KAG6276314.1 hypothetical protein E4U48_001667 [Claviceps purpurea]
MLFHRYLALLFASAIPSSALHAKASAFKGFNYKSSSLTNVTSVQSNNTSNSTSNNTSTNCNNNATSTLVDPYLGHTADQVIQYLNLSTKAEGGYFRQTFEDPDKVPQSNRSLSSLMYYLLRGEDGFSRWQRVDATEVWHYYAGAPLVMVMEQNLENGSSNSMISVLGPGLFSKPEQLPQIVIPKGVWKKAISVGKHWTLVGTTGEYLLSQA